MRPENVVVLGGTASVSDDVIDEVDDLLPGRARRLGGFDRYTVGALLATSGWPKGSRVVYVTSGTALTDALTAAPAATHDRAPVLLTRSDSLPGATLAALDHLSPDRVVILGGTASVSTGVEEQLRGLVGDVERVRGADRYAVGAAVSARTFGTHARVAYVASGRAPADALVGGPAAGLQDGPLLLVQPEGPTPEVAAELARLSPRRVVVLGGTGSLPASTEALLRPAVSPGHARSLSTTNDARHACAVTDDGGVECWGDNTLLALGTNATPGGRIGVPVPVRGLPGPAAEVAAGGDHLSCALLLSGRVWCWGFNHQGAAGSPSLGASVSPTEVTGVTDADHLALGSGFGCVTDAGAVKCWGMDNAGQLGFRSTDTDHHVAVTVPGLATSAVDVVAGYAHACAVLEDGAVTCWGLNTSGQAGRDPAASPVTAATVVPLGAPAASVALGRSHSCALLAAGGVRCWGRGAFGELGDGTKTDSFAPVTPVGLGTATGTLTAGPGSCLLVDGEDPRCWGRFSGTVPPLGSGVGVLAEPTRLARLRAAVDLDLDTAWSCYRDAQDAVFCLGGVGSLGMPGPWSTDSPQRVTGY